MEESRYSRQTILFGNELQKKIEGSTIGLVGLGALGSNSAEALARMGVGNLILIDRDIVEEHNLHRTALYEESDVGLPKDYAARKKIADINSSINVKSYSLDIMNSDLSMLSNCDIILDCLDNMNARRRLNEYCLKNGKDWIYSSAIKNYGEAKIFINKEECYECLYADKETDERCTTHGVNPAIIRAVSSLQVNLLIKYLKGDYDRSLQRLNLEGETLIKLNVEKKKDCVCTTHAFSELDAEQKCGNNLWQFSFDKERYKDIVERNRKEKNISVITDEFVKVGEATIFCNGRILINSEENDAKILFEKITGFYVK